MSAPKSFLEPTCGIDDEAELLLAQDDAVESIARFCSSPASFPYRFYLAKIQISNIYSLAGYEGGGSPVQQVKYRQRCNACSGSEQSVLVKKMNCAQAGRADRYEAEQVHLLQGRPQRAVRGFILLHAVCLCIHLKKLQKSEICEKSSSRRERRGLSVSPGDRIDAGTAYAFGSRGSVTTTRTRTRSSEDEHRRQQPFFRY